MNELPLEEIMKIVEKANSWQFVFDPTHERYSGNFSYNGFNYINGQPYYGKVQILKTKEGAVKEGVMDDYTVVVTYNGFDVAGLRGQDAAKVYDKVKKIVGEIELEDSADIQKKAVRDKVKAALAPKPEKLPLIRRLGK